MKILPGIFFKMNPGEADSFFSSFQNDIDMADFRERELVLGDLVPFRQIGIKIIFPRKPVHPVDAAIRGKGGFYSEFYRLPGENREDSGEAQADRTDLAVRRGPERGAASAEEFGPGQHLGMYFQPDDHLIFHREGLLFP